MGMVITNNGASSETITGLSTSSNFTVFNSASDEYISANMYYAVGSFSVVSPLPYEASMDAGALGPLTVAGQTLSLVSSGSQFTSLIIPAHQTAIIYCTPISIAQNAQNTQVDIVVQGVGTVDLGSLSFPVDTPGPGQNQ